MHGLGDSIYEKGFAEGLKIGYNFVIDQGGMKLLISLVKEGLLNLSDAARKANMSESEFLQLMEREEWCCSYAEKVKRNKK